MSKPVRRKRALSVVVASLSLSALQAPAASALQDFRGNAEAFMLQEARARAGFCDGTVVTESYAAVSSAQWEDDGNSSCGRCAEIWCVSDGTRECASTTPQVVQVVDRCADCGLGDLRVSSSVFQLVAEASSSSTSVQWRYVDCGASDGYSNGALDGDGGEDTADAVEMPQTWTGISFDELNDPAFLDTGEASRGSGSLEVGADVAGSGSDFDQGPDAGSASGTDTGFDSGSDASIGSAWSGSLDSEPWTKPASTSSAAPTTSTPSPPASDVPSGTPSTSATAVPVATDTASPSSSSPYPSSATTVPASVLWSYPPSLSPTPTTAPGDHSPSASPPASVDPVQSATDYPVGTVTTPTDPPDGNAQETTTDANQNAQLTVSPAISPASTAASPSSTSAESTTDEDRSSTNPAASSDSQHKASDNGNSTKGTGSNSPSNDGNLGTSTFNRSPIFYASIIVGVVGLVGAIVGYRAKRKRSHRDEMRAYQHSVQSARTPTSACSSHPVPAHPISPTVHVVFL